MSKDSNVVDIRISVSPLYVLITLRDSKDGTEREVCTLATYLHGAIAEEYHLDVLDDQRRIFDIAMGAPSRVFEFRNKKARNNVTPVYTREQLADVRRLVRGKSRLQLGAEARVEESPVTKIYRRNKGKQFWVSYPYRVAVAHVLLEHGVLVGEAHDTGSLYVDRPSE